MPSASGQADDWQILRVLSIYRLTLVGALTVLYYTQAAPSVLGNSSTVLFQTVIYFYLAAAVIFIFLLRRKWLPRHFQAYVQFGTDTAALTLIAYASGGVPSGMATLLITPTVACSLILGARISVLMAAIATVSLFGEEFFRQVQGELSPGEITQTGILGGILMITALAANLVATRARTSEARAREVGAELANMARLNENVIELLQTGVVVVDSAQIVRSLNAAARRLLGLRTGPVGQPLASVCAPLAQQWQQWRENGGSQHDPFSPSDLSGELAARFTRLGWGANAATLILIEDIAELRLQAQQMKLAALGRLSASIAHEIRNPLSAISQAGQLLDESAELDLQGRRLVQMVLRHSGRIDRIVTDVLSLSRRERSDPQTISLSQWLDRCVSTYHEEMDHQDREVDTTDVDPEIAINFDPGHLQQVLHNLWDNAFDHAKSETSQIRVSVHVGTVEDSGRNYLDIVDNGAGISADTRDKIFEPFFTTAHDGTGLGLFMARELCEYNQARLSLLPADEGGARFRILLAEGPQTN